MNGIAEDIQTHWNVVRPLFSIREAQVLLEQRGLRNLIEEYAPVYVVGSYTLELMVWRNLDLAMDAPDLTVAQFFELGRRITDLLTLWKMFFTDNRTYDSGRYPRGLYWGIRLGDIKQGAWKIDLWTFDSDECQSKVQECEALKARLTNQSREWIMDIKSRVFAKPRRT